MKEFQKEKLKEKLLINKQKMFTKQVAQELGIRFDNALFGVDRNEILNRLKHNCRLLSFYSIDQSENEIIKSLGDRIYKEFGYKHKIEDCLKLIKSMKANHNAYLWFINQESPIFLIQVNEVIKSLQEICIFSRYDFVFSSEDFKSGIAVSNSGGYVMNDYNPDEIIYEFEAWGIFEGYFNEGNSFG